MKNAKIIAIILTLCILCIPIGSQFAYGVDVSMINESVMHEEKRICTATLEDDFAGDCVLVVMTMRQA